jgi:gamma-glutamylputrescine oxidase
MQYDLSYWEQHSFFEGIDVAIVGSGIVGLSAAIHTKIRQPRWRVVVLERGMLPIGASTRNAGFACFGSMTELLDDMQHMSEQAVLDVVNMRWRGLQLLRSMVGDAALEYRGMGGYEMFTDEEKGVFDACKAQLGHFNEQIGRITGHNEVYRIADADLPRFGFGSQVRHLIHNQAEGQVHTGRMMAALLRLAASLGVQIFNGARIAAIEDASSGVALQMEAGWVLHAAQVLVCTNGFARQLMPALEVTPARNQVLITRPIPNLPIEGCFHYDRGYYYFRNIDQRILLGGGRNLDLHTEQTEDFGPNPMIRAALERLLHEVVAPNYPVEIESWWTGILGLGPVKRPIIERVSSNVAVAVRMSGMGVAIGSLVGEQGADLLVDR